MSWPKGQLVFMQGRFCVQYLYFVLMFIFGGSTDDIGKGRRYECVDERKDIYYSINI